MVRRALVVEMMKVRRSPVPLTTATLIVALVPLMCLGFLALSQSGGLGPAAAKAQGMIVGEGWEAYIGLLGQMLAVTLFIGPGVVVAWAFGREFADRTFPSLFALPVSRGAIAAAKFLVLLVWGVVLTLLVLGVALAAGLAAGVEGRGDIDLVAEFGRLLLAGALTIAMALTIGLVASLARGYLAAIGAIILLTMAAQIAVSLGTGGWFPFASPGLLAVAGADGVPPVTPAQLALVPVTALAAAIATTRWWSTTEVT